MKTNIIQTTIEFNQAIAIYQEQTKISEQYRKEIIEEIETSCFDLYDASDIAHYAEILGITPNEVREMNRKAQRISRYEMIASFENSDIDDIIDYF